MTILGASGSIPDRASSRTGGGRDRLVGAVVLALLAALAVSAIVAPQAQGTPDDAVPQIHAASRG